MKHSDMTSEQLNNRASFVGKVSAAGWDLGGWDMLFQSGAVLTPEAQAEYQNVAFDLRLSYYVSEDCIGLEAVGNGHPIILNLKFYSKTSLGAVVDKIVSWQDTMSRNNYTDFIKAIAQICDYVLFETPEGWIQISS